MHPHLISLMILLPLIGAVLQGFVKSPVSRWAAITTSLVSSIFGILLVASLQGETADLQRVESLSWIGSYAISYSLGVDGLNVLPFLLVSIIFPLLIAAEWSQRAGSRGMHALFLILQSALLGAVCAQDLFLMFFFWGLSSLPFYFLIGIWGSDQRESAAFRAIVTSAIGNALFFGALILIYYAVDPHTFSLKELAAGKLEGKMFSVLGQELSVSGVAFLLLSAGLAFRAPIWPLHGWFTQIAEEAPPSAFVAISAVSVPVATYIFMRLTYSLFPTMLVKVAPVIVLVGAVNLLAGGIGAAAQRGLRLLLAYVTISQLGLILIGIGSLNSAGVVGSLCLQLALGLSLAGFGLFAGIMAERTGRFEFLTKDGKSGFGGVAMRAPIMAVVAGVVIASLLGFPGFGGFVGSSLLMVGSYSVYPVAVILGAVALLLAAYYLFTMYRFVFLGELSGEMEDFSDLTLREQAYLLPIVGCLILFGVFPKPLLDLVKPTVTALLTTMTGAK